MLPLAILVSLIAAVTASSSHRNVVYWGQNSGHNQVRLRHYCEKDSVDMVVLAFANKFPDLQLNFSNMCSLSFSDGLLYCPDIGSDIKYCQEKSKPVLLSLGGARGSYGFQSEEAAKDFAKVMWDKFGGGNDEERPFGDAIVDGYDFDFEGSADFMTEFALALQKEHNFRDVEKKRPVIPTPADVIESEGPTDEPEEQPTDEPEEQPTDEPEEQTTDEPEEQPTDEPEEESMDEAEEEPMDEAEDFPVELVTASTKKYLFSATPQCVYPDTYLRDVLEKVDLDFVFIQFYNNVCNFNGRFNYATDWQKYAEEVAVNRNILLFIGLPGALNSAETGYVSKDTLQEKFPKELFTQSHFGGFMIWDASSADSNIDAAGESYDTMLKAFLDAN